MDGAARADPDRVAATSGERQRTHGRTRSIARYRARVAQAFTARSRSSGVAISSLALFTPSDVFHGRVELVAAERQRALDAAYAAQAERFPHGAPRVPRPPAAVHINPLNAGVVPVANHLLGLERTDGAERADAREARAPARMAPLRGAGTPAFAT